MSPLLSTIQGESSHGASAVADERASPRLVCRGPFTTASLVANIFMLFFLGNVFEGIERQLMFRLAVIMWVAGVVGGRCGGWSAMWVVARIAVSPVDTAPPIPTN